MYVDESVDQTLDILNIEGHRIFVSFNNLKTL